MDIFGTQKRKRREQAKKTAELAGSLIGLAILARDYQDRKESEELDNEIKREQLRKLKLENDAKEAEQGE